MGQPVDLLALSTVIEGVSGRILDYALLLAAVGTITMALVELLKAVTRARLFFQRRMIAAWTGGSGAVESELLALAAGGPDSAASLYDQPSGKMMGQIQAAANVALDFPTVYPALYGFLTEGSSMVGATSDRDRWKTFAARMSEAPPPAGERGAVDVDARASTQARARLGNLVTRRLDALQTRIDYRWARLNQTVAVIGGAALLFYALSTVSQSSQVPAFTRLLLALLGGLIAPFAKDVVNRLAGLQARR